jgi:hypothetical protein
MAGYTDKPLWKKLGYQSGMAVLVINAPSNYEIMLGELPPDVHLCESARGPYAVVHLFTASRDDLDKRLKLLRNQLAQHGMIWVSWPKKSSKVATDVTDNIIREVALPLGFVDVKVCAVDEVWSGLKLVIRETERTS